MNNKEQLLKEPEPLKPLVIDKQIRNLVEAYLNSYPWHYHGILDIAKEAKNRCEYEDLRDLSIDGGTIDYNYGGALGFKNYKPFWQSVFSHSEIQFGNSIIEFDLFENIRPSNTNAIYKTAGKQGLSYSLVASKVGIKIELLIKTLRQDIKDKQKLNKLVFDELKKFEKQIQDKFLDLHRDYIRPPSAIVWDRLDNRIYSRVYVIIAKKSLNDRVNLPRLKVSELDDVFSDIAYFSGKFYEAFNPFVEKINIKEIEKKL